MHTGIAQVGPRGDARHPGPKGGHVVVGLAVYGIASSLVKPVVGHQPGSVPVLL